MKTKVSMGLAEAPQGTKWRPRRGVARPYKAENFSIKKGLPPPTLLELTHHGRRGSESALAELMLQASKLSQEKLQVVSV